MYAVLVCTFDTPMTMYVHGLIVNIMCVDVLVIVSHFSCRIKSYSLNYNVVYYVSLCVWNV